MSVFSDLAVRPISTLKHADSETQSHFRKIYTYIYKKKSVSSVMNFFPERSIYLKSSLKGHGHEHNFKNSTAQKHVYTIGNLLTVVKFS